MYHVPRVYRWLKGEDIYPIYIEVGLFGGCNLRCEFCAFDYLNYTPKALDKKHLKEFIKDAATCGVKSILYSGEGEPLLYKGIGEVISYTKKQGIDVALSTNGLLLDEGIAKDILFGLSWLRISINAGDANSYSKIHGADKSDFRKVCDNIQKAVRIRNKNKNKCVIGIQSLLLPQNYEDLPKLAKISKRLSVDYLVIKPYCEHPLGQKNKNYKLQQKKIKELEKKLAKYLTDNFAVIFRHKAMEKNKEDKPYKKCLGLAFCAHISADGEVYPCNAFVGNKKYSYGNISKNRFKDIWLGKNRKKITKQIYTNWNIGKCRRVCRLDDINQYLWELKNPIPHINFI